MSPQQNLFELQGFRRRRAPYKRANVNGMGIFRLVSRNEFYGSSDRWTTGGTSHLGPDPPSHVHVVTEITRASRNRYEYDARKGVFILNRVLYTFYPCDYGFVPRTLDEDCDPLDAILLLNESTFTSCVTLA